ncbi:MAG TPA: dTDP-glucose 4,6-dehydratase [Caulobacteraceae bacterium]|nr:dTDP-glucose 4,6-dehydratase [Caulobacteraceae bacterium]
MRRSLLITGGAGFIGANFVRYWRAEHPDDQVVVLDALTYAGNRANLAGISAVDFVHGDIRDEGLVGAVLADHAVDTIVHFAAESHVDRSIHGPDAFIETNVVGAHALLKAARAAWLDKGTGRPHRFHHISTDEVYGSLGPADPAFHELTPYAPNSPYSASKAASDHLVRAYNRTFGLETTISNCSNNFGPFQHPEKLIPLFLINALHGRALPVYGDGQNVRDWLDVADHCRAIGLILDNGRPGETYNVGGGAEMTNLALIERLCSAVDTAFTRDQALASRFPDAPAASGAASASLKTHVPDRLGHDRRYAIDDSKIRRELGYAPVGDFAMSLAATLDWYLANEAWWRAATSGDYEAWLKQNYR